MLRTAIQDVPPIGRPEAARLARAEYERFLEMLRGLDRDVWERPTDCTRWTVKDVAAHIVGETEAFASPREFVHQWRLAPRVRREIGAHELIDGVNEVQVRERRTLSPAQLIERMADSTEAAARLRERLPRPARAVPVTFPAVGRRSVGYLVDLVITRDVWMHRVDISRAAGADLVLTSEHDGRLVAD
ncbi:MAG TPA: maleylpyruvate isomerase family mycothiol-dependent enzyme, partial [Solirubrobacteraceae bacterium]|nr:maleylpyruvate isomerase family mycothiol-dependent enzyme [Solirubrobacteraceae bacterium]